jgi:calcium permeable stress-gated cation channel
MIELYVQHAYFAFQVIQVFLVTTLTSAASAAITTILEDPTSAKDLLSQNLPKASNFYLSYFLLQSLALGSSALVQYWSLWQFHVLQRFSHTPRKTYLRWHRLRRMHWGAIFPVYTNLGVIALSYALIAPIVLGFAAVGVGFLHVVFRYNLIFVYDSEVDTKGLVYPRALMHLLLGLYFSEICCIGLFSLKGAYIPTILMAILLVITGLVHSSLIDALGPLLRSLPKSLTKEEDDPLLTTNLEARRQARANDLASHFEQSVPNTDTDPSGPEPEPEPEHLPGSTRSTRIPEGAPGALNALSSGLTSLFKKSLKTSFPETQHPFDALLKFWQHLLCPSPAGPSNWFLRWLHPEIFSDYAVLRKMVPTDLPDPSYSDDIARDLYFHPSFTKKAPEVWIPRDPGGISEQEVRHCGKVIPTTDKHVSLNEEGGLKLDLDAVKIVFDIDRLRY